jgi:hypothetical protein
MEDVEQPKTYCNGCGVDRAVEIERLAALESLDYEIARKAAADRLGMRTAVLDDLRAQKRRELKLDNARADEGQGRMVQIEDVLPWADAIEGDHVASALAATLKRFVVLSDASADAIALWVLHTWLVDKFTISPRLAITSPTKGCGKTTVLRFLNQIVRRPKRPWLMCWLRISRGARSGKASLKDFSPTMSKPSSGKTCSIMMISSSTGRK